MSGIFDKTDEKRQNRPENQELGPILGQNGDPDLIKQFFTILTTKIPPKNKNWVKNARAKVGDLMDRSCGRAPTVRVHPIPFKGLLLLRPFKVLFWAIILSLS